MLTNEAPSAPWTRTGPDARACTVEPDCPFPGGGLGSGTSAGGMDTSLRCDGPGPPGPSTRIWNGCADADLVVTGTTTVVADGATVADAVPVAIAVTDANPVGTGVPVGATVTSTATEVSDATVEGDASGAGDAAIVAAVVMVTTDVGETVGTDWPDAAGGGIKATKRPATANAGMTRRLNMRRWGWTTNVTPSRCPKARSPHRTQLFGSGVLDHHNGLHARGLCVCTESTGRT